MIDDEIINGIYVRFFIRGQDLDPDEITKNLGISPAYKFKPGDRHGENNQSIRKQGFWSITSGRQVKSTDLELHLEWILSQLEAVKSQLESILSNKELHAQITCVFNLFTLEWDDWLKPEMLKRITDLNIFLGISVYCLNELNNRLNDNSQDYF